MANVKISDLPAASTPLTGTELVPIVQSGVTSQTTVGGLLGGPNGSNLAGFLQSGTGAVATTVQAKLRQTVSVFDFMPPAQITYIQAGNTASQDGAVVTAAIQAAFTAIKSTGGVLNFPKGNYFITSGFGTSSSNTTDFANNLTIEGNGSTITCDGVNWPVGNTAALTLEGNNVAVKNLTFTSNITFDQYNTNPTTYRTRIIIGIVIGGKAASYFSIADNLSYYKTGAIVDNCSFTNIHSPIIATQSSHVRITNNYIYSYNTTGIVGWNCPEDLEIRANEVKLGADDCISIGMRKASQSAWTTAGYEAGNCRILDNRLGYTRARCIGTGGYSNVIIANNQCQQTLLSGIAIHGDPNLYATGSIYNRNIVIHNNTILSAGRFYNTTSAYAYWTGPVTQENNAIGTYGYSGKISTVTLTIASPCVVSWTAHGLNNGDQIYFTTTGALPTGLTANTIYYVVNKTTDTFQVAAISGGTAINTSGSQSGTQTCSILLPKEITISNNYIQNPSGAAFYLYALDGVNVINNTATTGTADQGSGNVNTNGSVFVTLYVSSVVIQNNVSYPSSGVAWNYTYTITSSGLTSGNMHIRFNYALDEETFDTGNLTPASSLISYTCLDKYNRIGVGKQQPSYAYEQLHQSGADRLMLWLAVQGATNGFAVKWNNATSKLNVNMADLPTSSAGLSAGDLWNSAGTLKIV